MNSLNASLLNSSSAVMMTKVTSRPTSHASRIQRPYPFSSISAPRKQLTMPARTMAYPTTLCALRTLFQYPGGGESLRSQPRTATPITI